MKIKNSTQCIVDGCNKSVVAKGYCKHHYQEIRRHGHILTQTKYMPNQIIIKDNFAEIVINDKYSKEKARALIDIEDIEKIKVHKLCLDKRGYVCCINKQYNFKLHRYLLNCPDDMVVDHINHNPLDNRKANLRICTHRQNCCNRDTNGKIFGVKKHKKCGWEAYIGNNGKKIHLGVYSSEAEAIVARKEAEKVYFGDFAPE
jgi:hypothetical protein